jgi:eukaryotic-like serine/threonine-protein kinase
MAGVTQGGIFAGDFQVVRPLGTGGMGSVYLTLQLSTGRKRALKVLHPHRGDDPRIREQFIAESRIAAQLDSDHIADVVAAGIDPDTGSPWLATEYLEGETLESRVRRSGRLAPAEAREVVRQVCHAMGQAHAAGLIHRDLKPANLFVADPRREGVPFTVKVLDFGIAKLTKERARADTSQPIGSPLWMAPEQCGPHRASAATDVWALGLIAYFCLVGRSFWTTQPSHGVAALFGEILTERIPNASERAFEHGATLPAGFDEWFARCVARDPLQRHPDAWQALAALASWNLDAPGTMAIASSAIPSHRVTWSAAPAPIAPDTHVTQPPTWPASLPPSTTPQYSTGTLRPLTDGAGTTSTRASRTVVGLILGAGVAGLGALLLAGLAALYLFADVSPRFGPVKKPAPAAPPEVAPVGSASAVPAVPTQAPGPPPADPSSASKPSPMPVAAAGQSAPAATPTPEPSPAPKTVPTAATPPAGPTPSQAGGFRALIGACWVDNEGASAESKLSVSVTVRINGMGVVHSLRVDGAAAHPAFRRCVVTRGSEHGGFKQPPPTWDVTTISTTLPAAK